jgi:hypothetical protein
MDQIAASDLTQWLNENQGVLAVSLFTVTILFGWLSGIFANLRSKPRLLLSTIEGPTFVCTFGISARTEHYDIHRTGIALYLRISNVGTAPTSIENISVGYRWAIHPSSKDWWKYGLFRFWLNDQTLAIADFQTPVGAENTKFYPFLCQTSVISGSSSDTFLEVGKSTNGVVYFEQNDSYGGCFPYSLNHKVSLKVVVTDVYGKKHRAKFDVPKVSLTEARKYNPRFGQTLMTIRSQNEIFDLPTDAHGNLIPPQISEDDTRAAATPPSP